MNRLILTALTSLLIAGCGVPSGTKEVNARDTEVHASRQDSAPTRNRILNLYDAFGSDRENAVKDFGFSALVEYEGRTILFDSGTNAAIFKQNVEAFGVDLHDIDFAVGSHSHPDHISGFDYLLEVNPNVRIYLPNDPFGLGAPLSFGVAGAEPEKSTELAAEQRYFEGEKDVATIESSGRFWRANVEYVKESISLGDGIRLIATTSPFMGYFSKYPNVDTEGNPTDSKARFVGLPEISLLLDAHEGQVLIVGCSHSGVEAIVKEAMHQSGEGIGLVMGGYHLIPYGSDELLRMARRMKDDLGVHRVAPAHCTGHLAFGILHDVYGSDYVFAGLGSEIAF